MALSASTNYLSTRDNIIKRALRIIGAIDQGATPPTSAVTEAALTLNEIFKEWAADGLHMWRYLDTNVTLVAATQSYSVGESQTVNVAAPLKVVQAARRITDSSNLITDVPLIICNKTDWMNIPNKYATGTPTHVWYRQPAAPGTTVAVGTLYFWPIPDANFVSSGGNTGSAVISYMAPLQDFDGSTDNPDVPAYMTNALVWALADQLQYEYGVPIAERAQISKKAQMHKAVALSFDQEEGSLYFQPEPNWGGE